MHRSDTNQTAQTPVGVRGQHRKVLRVRGQCSKELRMDSVYR